MFYLIQNNYSFVLPDRHNLLYALRDSNNYSIGLPDWYDL